MSKFPSQIALFTVFVLNTVAVCAAPPPNPGMAPQQHQFSQMDTNGDGYVSFDEYSAWHLYWLEWKFQRIDSDSDGYLSENEFHTTQGGKMKQLEQGQPGQGAPLK